MAADETETNYKFRIISLGEGAVGKTAITHSFKCRYLWDNTQIYSFLFKNFICKRNEQTILLQFWDKRQVKSITDLLIPKLLKEASAILFVFSVESRESFEKLPYWLDLAKELEIPKILVGNKMDLIQTRVITQEEAQQFAQEHNLPYIETSAKKKTNLQNLLDLLLDMLGVP
ncbi:MAG: GTP-binding protein [Candidatus Heimdallarchaeota archaeon]|nr:GTP-binding protein [Candidatus Heimdallarchaeota archaeon]